MKFYPIINFNFEDGDKPKLYYAYRQLICVLKDSYDRYNKKIKAIEISTASEGFWDNYQNIIELIVSQSRWPIAFGSIKSLDEFLKIKEICSNYAPQKHFDIFSANLNHELLYYFARNKKVQENFNYIPGISSEKEFEELGIGIHFIKSIKIFPYYSQSKLDLINALKAPYPELRNQSITVLESPKSIEQKTNTVFEFETVQEYCKERHKLLSPNNKPGEIKVIQDAHFKNNHQRKTISLIGRITGEAASKNIVLSGFAGLKVSQIKELIKKDLAQSKLGAASINELLNKKILIANRIKPNSNIYKSSYPEVLKDFRDRLIEYS